MKETLKVIGLMSGTSLDGLDIAYVSFSKKEKLQFELLNTEFIPYSQFWKDKLSLAFFMNSEKLKALDLEYGQWLGDSVLEFINRNNLQPDLISSHGHTIFHRPKEGITLQIGSGKKIREITQIPVVNNFREQDVKLGGQGAPLVPIGDELLFPEYDFCLNLGGFSNISWRQNGQRLACDISPCNIILNSVCKRLHLDYDKDGSLSKSGVVIQDVLQKWNQLEFYKLPPPKSLGREWIELHFNEDILSNKFKEIHLLATAVQHIAFQIHQFIISCTGNNESEKINVKVLTTGGGAYNTALMQSLQALGNQKINYIIPEKEIIDFKEAIVFAFLGYLRWISEINVLASVTGAKMDHSSGEIYK